MKTEDVFLLTRKRYFMAGQPTPRLTFPQKKQGFKNASRIKGKPNGFS